FEVHGHTTRKVPGSFEPRRSTILGQNASTPPRPPPLPLTPPSRYVGGWPMRGKPLQTRPGIGTMWRLRARVFRRLLNPPGLTTMISQPLRTFSLAWVLIGLVLPHSGRAQGDTTGTSASYVLVPKSAKRIKAE